jgi:serine protease Do
MQAFGAFAERLRRSTVQVFTHRERGGGSGVIWNSDGAILTNSHVARSAEMQVELWDGRRFPARVASRDPRRDLAELRISASGLEPASPADSNSLRPGELVMAIGSPLGFAGALSTGVIHSIGSLPGMGRQSWIRANVRLAPGNSGGPLADAQGRVIGINTAIVNGLGVAVPSNAISAFVSRGPRPSLGVTLRPGEVGLEILELDPKGAAARASLRAGDLLLMSYDDLNDALDSGPNVLRLQFFRGDRTRVREAFVQLGVRAEAA